MPSKGCVLGRIGLSLAVLVASLSLTSFTAASAHSPHKKYKARKHIRKRAKRQIGEPYAYGGTSPGGFDCSGLTRWVFKRHGAWLPHSATAQFALARERGARRVWKRKRLRKGDLVFFDTTSAKVGHAGIYIGRGRFVSATSSGGVRVDSVWDPYYWGHRYIGGTRLAALRGKS